MAKFRRKGDWLDWRRCYTGYPPVAADTGLPAQRIMSWLAQWRQYEQIAEYSGRPDKTLNGNGTGEFHIISYSAVPADTGATTRCIGTYIRYWDISFAGVGSSTIKWYDPWNTGSPQTLKSAFLPWSGVDDTYGSKANCWAQFFYYDESGNPITYTPTAATDGFRHSMLEIDNACCATVGVWNMPSEELTDDNLQVGEGNVSCGETIRGYDGGAGTSLGALIHLLGAGTETESVEKAGRRCLFQTAYPVGVYQTNTGGYEAHRQDTGGNPWKYKIRVRNPQGLSSGTQLCYPAIVLTADEGVDVKFIADSGDWWTYTVGVGGVTDQLVTYSDGVGNTGVGLEVDNDAADYVDIQVNAGVAEECTLQTVSLWEGPAW